MKLPVYRQGAGPLVVLVHGRGSHHGTWEPNLPALAGYQVLRVDLPGHGRAEAPEGMDPYRVEAQAEALAMTLADFPEPLALVGHSMGGWVSLRYALGRPENLRALVLEATSAANPFRNGRHRDYAEKVLGQVELAEREGMQALCEDLEAKGELHAVQRERLLMMKSHAYAAVIRANAELEDLDHQLPTLRVPTLVVAGLEDAVFEPECRRLAERIPGARSLFLPGIAHSPHGEATARYDIALLAFLGEYLGAPAGKAIRRGGGA